MNSLGGTLCLGGNLRLPHLHTLRNKALASGRPGGNRIPKNGRPVISPVGGMVALGFPLDF